MLLSYPTSESWPVVAHVFLLIDESVLVNDPLTKVLLIHLRLVRGQCRRLNKE